jgi:hypothetical protein
MRRKSAGESSGETLEGTEINTQGRQCPTKIAEFTQSGKSFQLGLLRAVLRSVAASITNVTEAGLALGCRQIGAGLTKMSCLTTVVALLIGIWYFCRFLAFFP